LNGLLLQKIKSTNIEAMRVQKITKTRLHNIFDAVFVIILVFSPTEISKCIVVSNLTMDERLDKDYSGGHVTMERNSRVRIAPTQGGIGKVALIRRSPVSIDAFYANDLTDTVRFAFNFKVHNYSAKSNRFMILITNGCWEQKLKYKHLPSIEIGFRPFDQTFRLKFATSGKRISQKVRANKVSICILHCRNDSIYQCLHQYRIY